MEQPNEYCHPEDEMVERFAMNSLSEAELEAFEPHLLACPICQCRCCEAEEFLEMIGSTRFGESSRSDIETPGHDQKLLLGRAFSRNVFVSHGGRTMDHVEKVKELLSALALRPIVVKNMPSLGFSVGDKVRKWMGICRSAVVLATADDECAAVRHRSRPNVEHEVGMLQSSSSIRKRIVYLKEPTVRFASNYSDRVWIDFRKERVQDAFIPLIKELKAFSF